ncbi:hypothetical protein Ocin01_15842 [Orchesella cincta]|uniref:Uncharacterized protein n=1 Tax=Orchesella cincta TaxID=48709 RepID=A0A1D2MD18_ORCCI|nr:hypothetical protein Ocin01_15842 [Orchesella cincta]
MDVYDFDEADEVVVAHSSYHKKLSPEKYLARASNTPFKNIQQVIAKIREIQEKCARGFHEKDAERLSKLMQYTFQFRQHEILNNDLSVGNTIRNYPCLKCWKLLQEEFERVTRKSFIKFEFELNQVMEKLYKQRKTRNAQISNDGWSEKAVARIKNLDSETRHISEGESAYRKSAKMVVFISDHFSGQWINNLVKIEDSLEHRNLRRLHPTIVIKKDILEKGCATVYTERVRVMQDLNFLEAVLACYFLHYIFNLEYTNCDKAFFLKLDAILKLI